MADQTQKQPAAVGNTAVPLHGDHDRVAMLSLRADGAPDQHNPEIIGEREFALAATREQFKQQAVSAVDQQLRAPGAADDGQPAKQDPEIAALQAAHDQVSVQAEKDADTTVGALFTDDEPTATGKTEQGKTPPK